MSKGEVIPEISLGERDRQNLLLEESSNLEGDREQQCVAGIPANYIARQLGVTHVEFSDLVDDDGEEQYGSPIEECLHERDSQADDEARLAAEEDED